MTDNEFTPVIGLEVHAQLLTESKMFCGCSAHYSDSAPNTHVCAVCSGMPGALPVINAKAVEETLRTALALNCSVSPQTKFDRKNYSYPDLPKGYQISQYDSPFGRKGYLEYRCGDETLVCGITRVHLEEDTGKLFHVVEDGHEVSLVDYNRSGVPLMEIVSEPEIPSPEAASAYFEALRRLLTYLGVCDGNLQEGSMRADVNVSLRDRLGNGFPKVEIKNLNSFRAVRLALEYELERQRAVIVAGGTLVQETRGWSERDGATVSQRTKEYAHDYRYFPEPDLPPLHVSADRIELLKRALPELPEIRRRRYRETFGISVQAAGTLTEEKELGDLFEETLKAVPGVPPAPVANWITGDLSALLRESGTGNGVPVAPAALGALVSMVEREEISGKAAKRVLEETYRTAEDPRAIVDRLDLRQITDEAALEALVDGVLGDNPKLVDQYRGGKMNVIEALAGKAIATSRGKASPSRVKDILRRKLAPAAGKTLD